MDAFANTFPVHEAHNTAYNIFIVAYFSVQRLCLLSQKTAGILQNVRSQSFNYPGNSRDIFGAWTYT